MLSTNVSTSGWPISSITYQWRPPGGMPVSGAPGVRPQPPLGIEHFSSGCRSASLVAAAVQQHERPLRLAHRLADEV